MLNQVLIIHPRSVLLLNYTVDKRGLLKDQPGIYQQTKPSILKHGWPGPGTDANQGLKCSICTKHRDHLPQEQPTSPYVLHYHDVLACALLPHRNYHPRCLLSVPQRKRSHYTRKQSNGIASRPGYLYNSDQLSTPDQFHSPPHFPYTHLSNSQPPTCTRIDGKTRC